jgi:4-amino-4-deoxy-L-arabinose transferase-like glycosyltransferase
MSSRDRETVAGGCWAVDVQVAEREPDGRRWSWLGPGWLLLALAMLSVGLGDRALIDPDEGRNAVIAQEMAASGDFLVPQIDSLPYLDKPFLFFSVAATFIRWLGSSELAVRIPSLLFAWATVLLTAWFAARLFGRPTAWVAGVACATAILTVALARVVIFDSMLSFFVLAALVSFYLAVEAGPVAAGRFRLPVWTLLAWVAMAFGVFTKGPVALLVPLLVAMPYALWRRRLGAVLHPAGWLAHLLLILPWLVLTEQSVHGFLRYALVTETWQRLTSDVLHRNAPLWYFLPILFFGAFPWSVLAVASARRWVRESGRGPNRGALVFLSLWLLLPLAFFSLSHSKRIPYVLPLVPAVALAVAWSWTGPASRWRGVRPAAVGWLVFAGLLCAFWGGLGADRLPDELLADVASVTPRLAAISLMAGIAAWALAANRALAPVVLSLPLVLWSVIMAPLTSAMAERRSARAMAEVAAEHLEADTAILGIETYSPSLAFYLQRPIQVSSATGKVFRSNYILNSYDSLVGAGRSPLVPPRVWSDAVASCSRPLLVVVKSRYRNEIHELARAGLPLLYADEKNTLMGPCRASRDPAEPQTRNTALLSP